MAVLCTSLGVVCFFDYRRRKIPNVLIRSIFAIGTVRGVWENGFRGVGGYMFVAVMVLLLLYLCSFNVQVQICKLTNIQDFS